MKKSYQINFKPQSGLEAINISEATFRLIAQAIDGREDTIVKVGDIRFNPKSDVRNVRPVYEQGTSEPDARKQEWLPYHKRTENLRRLKIIKIATLGWGKERPRNFSAQEQEWFDIAKKQLTKRDEAKKQFRAEFFDVDMDDHVFAYLLFKAWLPYHRLEYDPRSYDRNSLIDQVREERKTKNEDVAARRIFYQN